MNFTALRLRVASQQEPLESESNEISNVLVNCSKQKDENICSRMTRFCVLGPGLERLKNYPDKPLRPLEKAGTN